MLNFTHLPLCELYSNSQILVKKLLKIIAVTFVALLILVLLVPVALYTPWVQRVAVHEALAIMNDNDDDLRYDIGALRLRWPLDV